MMVTGIRDPLLALWLFYSIITGVGTVKVTTNTPSVQVTRGGSVLLRCSFRTTAAINRLNIIWTVSPLEEPKHPIQVISYEQGQIVESLSEYLGRVRFAFQPTHDASIFINHTRTSDTGTYQCTVINPPDGATPNIAVVGLTVLVPPSSPDCSSEGQGKEGGRIYLRCSVTEGVPVPTFKWEKIQPDGQVLITSQEGYRGSATITNLTLETSGLYRCTVTNPLGSRSCAVELQIRVGGLSSMSIFAAISMTLIMGLVLLVLFALVLCFHHQSRRKHQDEEMYRVETLSSRPQHITRSPHSDTGSRRAIPMWASGVPLGQKTTPIMYNIRRGHVSVTPHIGRHRTPPGTEGSTTDSEEDNTSPVPVPLTSSLYSVTSGYLV